MKQQLPKIHKEFYNIYKNKSLYEQLTNSEFSIEYTNFGYYINYYNIKSNKLKNLNLEIALGFHGYLNNILCVFDLTFDDSHEFIQTLEVVPNHEDKIPEHVIYNGISDD